ncbi:MAG: TerB family tellurite resistance protein [Gammaproteobacteria bacterium]
MFNFFKKVKVEDNEVARFDFDLELIGCALAYEIAISDGKIDSSELDKIKNEITIKSKALNLVPEEVFATIKNHSEESVSFNDFINQINENFSQDQKLEMISFLWRTAYADNVLDVDEERLIRRIADMIRIKDMQVLKLKHQAKLDS